MASIMMCQLPPGTRYRTSLKMVFALPLLLTTGRGYCGCKCECDASQYGWKWEGDACECPSNMNDCYDVASNIPVSLGMHSLGCAHLSSA